MQRIKYGISSGKRGEVNSLAWFEHLFGFLAMLTCASWSMLFCLALSKARAEQRKDKEWVEELERRLAENGNRNSVS